MNYTELFKKDDPVKGAIDTILKALAGYKVNGFWLEVSGDPDDLEVTGATFRFGAGYYAGRSTTIKVDFGDFMDATIRSAHLYETVDVHTRDPNLIAKVALDMHARWYGKEEENDE